MCKFPHLSTARTLVHIVHQILLHRTLNPCVKKWELFLFQKRRLKINVRPKGRKKHPLRQRKKRRIELRNCLPTDPLVLVFNQLNHI